MLRVIFIGRKKANGFKADLRLKQDLLTPPIDNVQLSLIADHYIAIDKFVDVIFRRNFFCF
jgi:hypothetical protein